MAKSKQCSICGEKYKGFGNNARPINDGRCCDSCNGEVILARLQRFREKQPMHALDHELVEMNMVTPLNRSRARPAVRCVANFLPPPAL